MGGKLSCIKNSLNLTSEIIDLVQDFDAERHDNKYKEKLAYLTKEDNYHRFSKSDRKTIKKMVANYLQMQKDELARVNQEFNGLVPPPLVRQVAYYQEENEESNEKSNEEEEEEEN